MEIYLITNLINNKQYVGMTTRSVNERFAEHCKSGRKTAIGKAIQKYGRENFKVEILDKAENFESLKKKESEWIKIKNTYEKGYNETLGGEDQPMFHDCFKKAVSEKQKGKNNSFYKKTHTDELKNKWSKTRRGKAHGMYGAKRPLLSELNTKRVWSEESKKKISEKNSKPIVCVELNITFPSLKNMCETLGLDSSAVCKVLKGKRLKKHKGFTFRRVK